MGVLYSFINQFLNVEPGFDAMTVLCQVVLQENLYSRSVFAEKGLVCRQSNRIKRVFFISIVLAFGCFFEFLSYGLVNIYLERSKSNIMRK